MPEIHCRHPGTTGRGHDRDRVIPATQNLDALDPQVKLDIVAGQPRRGGLTAALTNSLGFGGHNASLVSTPAS
jgi:3-oxoacyl-[acyl-carrier-protein] synthase II